MKRGHSPESADPQKRSKTGLAWLGQSLQLLRQLSSKEAWHAAKQLVAEGSADVTSFVEDGQLSCCCITAQIAASENAAAFPHMKSEVAAPASVRLVLDSSSGQLLDADTSCCPGGFQPVLGSFCPYALAAFLAVAKQVQAPTRGAMQPMEGLPAWEGSSLEDVLRSTGQLPGTSSSNASSSGQQAEHKQQQQQQQQRLRKVHDALVAHPTCFTSGLGLEAWQYEGCVTASVAVHVASHRNQGMYGSYGGGTRPAADADKLASIEEAGEDLASHPWFQNVQQTAMQQQIVTDLPPAADDANAADGGAAAAAAGEDGAAGAAAGDAASLPADIRRTLLRAGIPIVGLPMNSLKSLSEARGLLLPGGAGAAAAGATAAAVGQGIAPDLARRRLLDKAVKQWLTTFGGEALPGWMTRPKVINDAFDLLVGSDSTPGRPLSSLVLLLRSLWEYLHHHGLGRLLAKPLKLLLALRSVLLVGVFPLWVRKAVRSQLELWERGLLWQHAATPLDAAGGHVGLVHLLRVGKEVHQLCLHHWDEPKLSRLLTDAFSEQHSDGGSSSSAAAAAASSAAAGAGSSGRAAAWAVEPPPLLQLRLQALDVMGASAAYLELAMAGGAWREAINRLLTSKERSQLLKAVKLLTRHITSLPERLKYMSQIVQLDSLGAPERLEVTARLLLDLREQLHPVQQPVKVSGKQSTRYNVAGSTAGHMWKATLWSLYEAPAAAANNNDPVASRVAAAAAVTQQHREHVELQQAWSKFLKLFLQTAAVALFKAADESIASHKEHLKEEGLLNEAADDDAAAAAAAEEAAAAARRREEAERLAREARVTRFFCPSCNRVHDHEDPAYLSEPPMLTPQPGDPDWKLLDIDDVLFAGAGTSTMGGIPSDAITGHLTQRTPAGYIKEQKVIDAFTKVVPVEFPQLLPLCGLDALCISSIATNLMQDFDAGGKLDTSLGIDPLRELLSHPVVEMGPGPVRLQAAIEAVVYTSTMTPLYINSDSTQDNFYRELVWALLGVGQRSLALLASRARYKVAPSAKAAGELLEVSISCGPEAQAAAVDLILGKGVVRPLVPEDDPVIRELEGKPAAAGAGDNNPRPGSPPRPGSRAEELSLLVRREMDRRLREGLLMNPFVDYMGSEEDSEFYSDEDMDMDEYEYEMYGGPAPPYSPPLFPGMPALDPSFRAVQRELLAAEVALADAAAAIAPLYPGALGMAAAVAAAAGGGGAAGAAAGGNDAARAGSPVAGRGGSEEAMSISSGGGSGSDSDGEVIDISSDSEGGEGGDAAGAGAAAGGGGSGRASPATAADAEAAAVAAEADAAEAAAEYRRQVAATTAIAEATAGSSAGATADGGALQEARNAAAAAMSRQQQLARWAARLRQAADRAAGRAPKRRREAADGDAAAAAAAGGGGSSRRQQRGGQQRHPGDPEHPAEDAAPEESDGLGSFDTRELLGADVAAALQLRDTASSRGGEGAAAAAAAAVAGGEDAAAARARDRDYYDDDEDHYYGRQRPVRNVPPAQNAPRPTRRPSKRRATEAAAAAAAAAAAGSSRAAAAAAAGGGGGGGGGDDEPGGGGDGGPSSGGRGHRAGRKHHHRPNSRNRRSGSLDGLWDPQQQALVVDLFGISHASHSQPTRTLRVHIHRLAGLQLWSVTKYAAGRGADMQQLQRLGMAAWLSDGNTSSITHTGQGLRVSEALRWTPVAADQAGWLEATQQLKSKVTANLPAIPHEPYAGVSISSRSWSGLPCASWDSFTAQERYPATYNSCRHDTPDANLAWLIAVLAGQPPQPPQPLQPQRSGSSGQPPRPPSQQQQQQQPAPMEMDQYLAAGKAALEFVLEDKKDRVAAAAAFLPIPYQGAMTNYLHYDGPRGEGYYLVPPDPTAAAAAGGGGGGGGGGSSGGDGAGSSKAAAAAAAGSSGSGSSPEAKAAAATAAAEAEQQAEQAASVTDVLQKLARLSKGIRFGMPMLQLCHALMEAGCRDPCLELLPQSLLPAGGTILSLQLHTCLVTDLTELLPMVAKHGDLSLRVGAAMSFMLVTRKALPAPLISQPEVLSGVLSWWLGLSSILHVKPEEWSAPACFLFIQDYFSSVNIMPHVSGASSWQQLQRMLITSILASLGGSTNGRSGSGPAWNAPSSFRSSQEVMSPADGFQLLLQCDAVKEAHWAFRLYLARLCYQMRLASTWAQLSGLLCPALSAAVAEHTSGWAPECREPLTDMKAWKEQRGARGLPASSARARDWVAETLEWLATEVLAGQDRAPGAGGRVGPGAFAAGGAAAGDKQADVCAFLGADAQASPQQREKLRSELIDTLAATLSGWYGPELLLLAAAVRPVVPTYSDTPVLSSLKSRKPAAASAAAAAAAAAGAFKQEQQALLRPLMSMLQAGLLPQVARGEELAGSPCVQRGQFRSALRALMGDRPLLAVLPVELLRCLCLTYWQQEATPEGFLTANEVLLRLEGAAAAQTLALPGATAAAAAGGGGGSAAAGSNVSSDGCGGGALGLAAGLKSLAAGLRSFMPGAAEDEGAAGVGEGGAAMPQVHAVLLEQLDLVPSKGGIEAAGLRFMQLQRHAAKGDHTAALESIFSSDAGSAAPAPAAPPPGGGAAVEGPTLSGHMEVVDAVLRLAADASSSNDALRSLTQCSAYQAIVGLEGLAACSDSGGGAQLLAPLGPEMQAHILKLCIWRLVRAIQQRPPPVELRRSLGPGFVSSRNPGGDMAYNRNNAPVAPSYLGAEVVAKWAARVPFNVLAGYCTELDLVQHAPGAPASDLALVLCTHLQQQEAALLWALQQLAALQTGPQLESCLVGLTSAAERNTLERLPVLMSGMGEVVKADRKMMWAYAALRHTVVADKITRYIRRSVTDVLTLQRYLAKSTIAEIQGYKLQSVPWVSWELGTKAAQAQELAEWLYWLQVTWPNERAALGLPRDAPSLYTSTGGRY